MKACVICERELPEEEFSRGWRSRCKRCYAAWMRLYRKTGKGWEVSRTSYQNYKERQRAGLVAAKKQPDRTTEAYRKYHRDYARKWRAAHPEEKIKSEARRTVRYALKLGVLEKRPCELCGAADAETHHHDYSKPLSVVWLCAKHHKQYHVEMSTAGLPSYDL